MSFEIVAVFFDDSSQIILMFKMKYIELRIIFSNRYVNLSLVQSHPCALIFNEIEWNIFLVHSQFEIFKSTEYGTYYEFWQNPFERDVSLSSSSFYYFAKFEPKSVPVCQLSKMNACRSHSNINEEVSTNSTCAIFVKQLFWTPFFWLWVMKSFWQNRIMMIDQIFWGQRSIRVSINHGP